MSKMEGSMQKIEETIYWLELLEGARLCGRDELKPLTSEANQLMAIFVTIVRHNLFEGDSYRRRGEADHGNGFIPYPFAFELF